MPANILVLNAGSSSLKFQLYSMPEEKELFGGVSERIGTDEAVLHWHFSGKKIKEETFNGSITDHTSALQEIIRLLNDKEVIVKHDPDIIVHRVVHGGIYFDAPAWINADIKNKISKLSELAPLHNPVNLRCIEAMEELFPDTKQVAVFDTSFYHQLPERAFRYAIDDKFYREDDVRVYGFHGISHQYVTQQAEDFLQDKNAKLISMHLGNGCSICAIHAGKPVEISMGFGPVSGLVMATRSGDIDPSVPLHLMKKYGFGTEEMDKILNRESGLKALCGMTDLRDIQKAVQDGSKEAAFACELYAYRIKKYLGAYVAVMNGLDAIIFTGGVGENSELIRQLVCKEMDWLGLRLDEKSNKKAVVKIRSLATVDSRIEILVIPTNEELEMARQAFGMRG
ncbi:MAG: acetate kinase [Chitinophagaceae bacterium]|nr:acetate kinase [Chitinophagaceae bacterium]